MNEDKERALEEKYPFMKNVYCECEDGWYELLDELCAKIMEVYRQCNLEPDIHVAQVKEKYGSLCFYYSFENLAYDSEAARLIQTVVDTYERKSASVCRYCGKKGKTRQVRGWTVTLCEECYDKETDRS